MTDKIPEKFKDLFQKKSLGHLSTLMKDGSPQVSPVWIDFKNDQILVNSVMGRIKDSNIQRDPRVAISIVDPDNPYKGLMIRGAVVKFSQEIAEDHIDQMATKYLGVDRWPHGRPGEVRILYYIEVNHVYTIG